MSELAPRATRIEEATPTRRSANRKTQGLLMRATTSLIVSIACTAMLSYTGTAKAAMYKCIDAGGRTIYTDHACNGDPKAKTWQPKQPLNVVKSETLTGVRSEVATDQRPAWLKPSGDAAKSPASGDKRPSWLKPMDPIGDCKRKGGTIDPEFRACRLP
jgi:Domain of unknown function (DUF4124)